MANAYKHSRHFKVITDSDRSCVTFSSIDNANSYIIFTDVFNTSSPIKTYTLDDGNTTLAVTYEFDTADKETAFKSAIDNFWKNNSSPFIGAADNHFVDHCKTVWYNADGSVSASTDNPGPAIPDDFFEAD